MGSDDDIDVAMVRHVIHGARPKCCDGVVGTIGATDDHGGGDASQPREDVDRGLGIVNGDETQPGVVLARDGFDVVPRAHGDGVVSERAHRPVEVAVRTTYEEHCLGHHASRSMPYLRIFSTSVVRRM